MDPAALAWAQETVRSVPTSLLAFHPKTRQRGPRGDAPGPSPESFRAQVRLAALSGNEVPGEFRTEVRQLWRASLVPPAGLSVDPAMVAREIAGGEPGRTFEILAVARAEDAIGTQLVLAEVASGATS